MRQERLPPLDLTKTLPSLSPPTVGFSSSALVYAVLRTVLAVALVFAAAFGGRRAWPIVGQAVSDVACVAFMIAYVDPDLRASLGWLALPLLLYVIVWEGWGALRSIDTESDTAADGVGADLLGWLGGFWRWLYRVLLGRGDGARAPGGAAGIPSRADLRGHGGVRVSRERSSRGLGVPRMQGSLYGRSSTAVRRDR